MKAVLSAFLILFFTTMPVPGLADSQIGDEQNYCYKPSKPLFFSVVKYEKRYAEDIKEYQRCRQSFIEMQERVTNMRKESEKNAQLIKERFESKKTID